MKDKVVLITGATSGIGKATALKFGAAGAKVVISGRRETEGQAVVDAVLFLASDSSSFVTGESLKVDGGFTAQ